MKKERKMIMNNTNRLYVDFHVLQTVPPSCINRDDTGSPKTAVYGGTTRARVSSQSWKRAIRSMFLEIFPDGQLGKRTKHLREAVAAEIVKTDPALDANRLAELVLDAVNVSCDKNGMTDALFFISNAQAKELAAQAVAQGNFERELNNADSAEAFVEIVKKRVEALHSDKKDAEKIEKIVADDLKKAKLLKKDELVFPCPAEAVVALADELLDKVACVASLKRNPSVDIALFGRMVASNATLNSDAAAQVAHSISTHTVQTEYDYFTAVDDCAPADNMGAGHLGTVEYNSSTLYRYATVNVTDLFSKLGEETADALSGFAEAFISSMPTGKQNTFANRTVPDMVYVTVRRDTPINMAPAFERPILPGVNGYAAESEKRLLQYARSTYELFADPPLYALAVSRTDDIKEMAECTSVSKLVERLEEIVRAELAENGETV